MTNKQHIQVSLHVSMVEELNDLVKRINKFCDDYDTPKEDYVSESEAIEFCIFEFDDDERRENIQQIIQMIERIRDAKEHENKIKKSFRIKTDFYDVLTHLKETLNKRNSIYKTYKIEDVLEYLIQTYSLNV